MATDIPGPSFRGFVAVPLPAQVRSYLWEATASLRHAHKGYKWVMPENYHVTLSFLGDTRKTDVPLVREALKRAVSGFRPFDMSLGVPGSFPSRGNPNVLYVGIDTRAGEISSLAKRVREALAEASFADDKPFRAHVTVARASRRTESTGLSALTWSTSLGPIDAHRDQRLCRVKEVILFRSELRPEGPRYSPVEGFTLGG